MSETFVISDTHFGHKNILTFSTPDGRPCREFSSVEEMDETMVERWNAVVKPHDKIYHLGDVVINKKFLPILNRLNGKKKLIMGNHDIFKASTYLEYFYDVVACRVLNDMILTHIPIGETNMGRFKTNVHGHIHNDTMNHPDYNCVCVEHIAYQPIPLYVLRERIALKKSFYQNNPIGTPTPHDIG